jgi:hypothetical protein
MALGRAARGERPSRWAITWSCSAAASDGGRLDLPEPDGPMRGCDGARGYVEGDVVGAVRRVAPSG